MINFKYRDYNINEAMNALYVYDMGATDSGVHDETMKAAVITYLKNLDDQEQRKVLAIYVRNRLTDNNLQEGYGLQDTLNFIEWLQDLGIHIV